LAANHCEYDKKMMRVAKMDKSLFETGRRRNNLRSGTQTICCLFRCTVCMLLYFQNLFNQHNIQRIVLICLSLQLRFQTELHSSRPVGHRLCDGGRADTSDHSSEQISRSGTD